MSTKEQTKNLTPPVAPGPDATEDEKREFNEKRLEYEQWRADMQREAAEKSPQTQDAR